MAVFSLGRLAECVCWKWNLFEHFARESRHNGPNMKFSNENEMKFMKIYSGRNRIFVCFSMGCMRWVGHVHMFVFLPSIKRNFYFNNWHNLRTSPIENIEKLRVWFMWIQIKLSLKMKFSPRWCYYGLFHFFGGSHESGQGLAQL